ncbi:unnamed protein product, partial [Urochloa humidicola]
PHPTPSLHAYPPPATLSRRRILHLAASPIAASPPPPPPTPPRGLLGHCSHLARTAAASYFHLAVFLTHLPHDRQEAHGRAGCAAALGDACLAGACLPLLSLVAASPFPMTSRAEHRRVVRSMVPERAYHRQATYQCCSSKKYWC